MEQFFLRRAQSIRPQQQVISEIYGSGPKSGLSMMGGAKSEMERPFEALIIVQIIG
jgi:hypothetical protein